MAAAACSSAASSSSSSSRQRQHVATQQLLEPCQNRRSEEEEDRPQPSNTDGRSQTLERRGGAIIPGLPDDLSSSCILTLLPISLLPALSSTSLSWRRSFLNHNHLHHRRHLLCIFPGDPHLLPSPHLLDPSTLLWLPLPPLPPNPHSHSLSHFQPVSIPNSNLLLLLGGSRFDARSFPLYHPSPSPSSYLLPLPPLLPTNSLSWFPLPDMPTPRGSFACAPTPCGGRLLVAGGGSRHAVFPCGGTRTDAVEMLDLQTREWTQLGPMSRARAGCVGWVMEGDGEDELWVIGGYAGYRTVSGVFPDDVHCRDGEVLGLRTGKWRKIGDMWDEGERRKLGKVAVIHCEDEPLQAFMLDANWIFRYDVEANRWFRETTLRRKLASDESCGFVSMNGELYVLTSSLSGHLADTRKLVKKKPTLDMQIYDPKKRKWRFLHAFTPFKQPLDFRIATLCTVLL